MKKAPQKPQVAQNDKGKQVPQQQIKKILQPTQQEEQKQQQQVIQTKNSVQNSTKQSTQNDKGKQIQQQQSKTQQKQQPQQEKKQQNEEVKQEKKDDMPPFYPDHGNEQERCRINEIVKDKLYLTNWQGAQDIEQIQKFKITHIININSDEQPLKDKNLGIVYKNIDDIEDTEENAKLISEKFKDCADFIKKANEKNHRVVVHCAAGISRSTTIILSSLMLNQGMKLMDAFKLVYKARRAIWPNKGFMRILIEFEQKLFVKIKTPTINYKDYEKWGEFNHESYQAAKLVDRNNKQKGNPETQNSEKDIQNQKQQQEQEQQQQNQEQK